MEQWVIHARNIPIATLVLAASAWTASAQAHDLAPWVQAGLGAGGAFASSHCDVDGCSTTVVGTFGAGLDVGHGLSIGLEASNHTGTYVVIPNHLHAHLRMFSARYQPFGSRFQFKAGAGSATYDALGLPRSRARVVGEIGFEWRVERRFYQFINVFVGSPASVEIAPGSMKGSQLMGVEVGGLARFHIG